MWGCELKSNESIFQKSIAGHPPCEDVSWKTCEFNDSILADGHPPCEDVSWKENDVKMYGTQV